MGLPKPMHGLQLLDLFRAWIEEVKLCVIEEREKSEMAQLCFNDISHEFYSLKVLKACFPFFLSYLFHLCET